MTVNKGKENEYKVRHNPIWPELEQELKRGGVHKYVCVWPLCNTQLSCCCAPPPCPPPCPHTHTATASFANKALAISSLMWYARSPYITALIGGCCCLLVVSFADESITPQQHNTTTQHHHNTTRRLRTRVAGPTLVAPPCADAGGSTCQTLCPTAVTTTAPKADKPRRCSTWIN